MRTFPEITDAAAFLLGRKAGVRSMRDAILAMYPTDAVTGSAATFPDGADDVPVIALACAYGPVQTGSGTPSAENIRGFSGQSGIRVFSYGRLVPASPLLQITAQPTDRTGAVGDTVSFHVEAAGSDVRYQWQYYNNSLWQNTTQPGYDTDTFSQAINANRLNYAYRCGIREGSGVTRYSAPARLIEAVPAITVQPETQYAFVGDTVYFHVEGVGDGLSYQWQYKQSNSAPWTDISGAQTDTLTQYVTATNLGYGYRCIITDAESNTYTSATAFLFEGRKETQVPPWVRILFSETVYAWTLDVLTGELTVTWGHIAAYAGETLPGEWLSDRDEYAPGATPTTGAEVVYKLDDPYVIQCVPVEARTALGDNSFATIPTSSVSVSYRADVELYIEKKIGEGT